MDKWTNVWTTLSGPISQVGKLRHNLTLAHVPTTPWCQAGNGAGPRRGAEEEEGISLLAYGYTLGHGLWGSRRRMRSPGLSFSVLSGTALSGPGLEWLGAEGSPSLPRAPTPPPPFLPSVAGEEPSSFSSWELCKTFPDFGFWFHGLPFLSLSTPFSLSFHSALPPNSPKVSFLPQDNGIWERKGVVTKSSGGRINFLWWEHLKDLHKCSVSSSGGRGGFPSYFVSLCPRPCSQTSQKGHQRGSPLRCQGSFGPYSSHCSSGVNESV